MGKSVRGICGEGHRDWRLKRLLIYSGHLEYTLYRLLKALVYETVHDMFIKTSCFSLESLQILFFFSQKTSLNS